MPSSGSLRARAMTLRPEGQGDTLTGHAEGPPQARGQLPRVVVPQLHAAHTDNLADEADFLPFQVLASQVLQIGMSVRYPEPRLSTWLPLGQTVGRGAETHV